MEIGVVLEAFLDQPLEELLPWLREAAPEITALEVGAGGYAPHPHCDVAELLASAQARQDWLDLVGRHGFRLDALNAWGNPLHPDADLAGQHDEALRDAIRLATLLGADRVVAMAGCPGAVAGDRSPHFGAGGWLPYLEGVWMGMDGHKVTEALGERVGHAHGKDTVFHADNLALNGLLDARWPQPAEQMPWTFAVPGHGHDLEWWTGLISIMTGSHAQVISIEHEDPFVPASEGVPEAARLLRAAIDASA